MLHHDATLATAEVGQVCVVIWRGAVTKEPFERQRSALAGVVERHPEGAGLLVVVETTAKPPDDELRRASAEMVKTHGKVLRCVACVVEGTGFIASINRSAISAMLLLVGPKHTRVGVFATVSEAASWVRRHVEIGSTDAFLGAVEHIRAELSAPPGSGHAGA